MKYCTKCGYGNDDTADFCASCGENLNGSAQQSEATPYNASANDSGNALFKCIIVTFYISNSNNRCQFSF